MVNNSKQRTKSIASNGGGNVEAAMTTTSNGAKPSRSAPYKKTRSQNKELLTQEKSSVAVEAAELEGIKRKISSTSPAETTAPAAAAATGKQIEPETATQATKDDVNTQHTVAEATEKTDNADINKNNQENNQDDKKDATDAATDTPLQFNPTMFRSATTTLQDTLALMNAKAVTRVNISCDDLDVVYKQFDIFIQSHPILGPVVLPMLKAAEIGGDGGSAAAAAAEADVGAPLSTETGTLVGGIGDGIAANLSSMLTDLEQNVLAAAAAASGDGGGSGERRQLPQLQAQPSPMPSLRGGWDAASLLNLPPALASALSDRLKNQAAAGGGAAATAPFSDHATATATHTTITTGGPETTILQEKLRRAIAAAQAGGGYASNYHSSDLTNTINNNTAAEGAAAATYEPGMSSDLLINQHTNSHRSPSLHQVLYHHQQQQNSLASGSPEYCQPSAADSAAIAAATAAALAGQSRAGLDKTPALELLRALSKINNNYVSEGGGVTTTYTHHMMDNALNKSFNYLSPEAPPSDVDGGDGDGPGEGSDYDEFGDAGIETRRSPSPTINPNTNRPVRRVVVQKAADELAASALVSLGAGTAAAAAVGGSGGHHSAHINGGSYPTKGRGNKFNRAGIKRSIYDRERAGGGSGGYTNDDFYYYHPGDSHGGGAFGGGINGSGGVVTNGVAGGSSLKKRAESKGGNGGGHVSAIEYRPEEGGLVAVGPNSGTQNGVSDNDVTAKVQLLMLMAQNLGEMQNAIRGGGGGSSAAAAVSGGSDGGRGDEIRAASEGAEEKTAAA